MKDRYYEGIEEQTATPNRVEAQRLSIYNSDDLEV